MGTLPNAITKRKVDETVIGVYWGYDGAAKLGTPPRLYNQIMRRVAIARNDSEADNARLFALVNVAMGDAWASGLGAEVSLRLLAAGGRYPRARSLDDAGADADQQHLRQYRYRLAALAHPPPMASRRWTTR